jgi:DNA end-binding protein Ku
LKAKHLDRAQLTDRLTKRIVALAEKKLKSGIDVVEGGEDEQETRESATDVIDLMQVLKERLEGKARPRGTGGGGGRSGAATDRLEEKSKAELYAVAQDRGIPGRSAMTKPQLIKALQRRTV